MALIKFQIFIKVLFSSRACRWSESTSSVELAISIFVTKMKKSYKRPLLDTKGSLTPRAIHVIYFLVVWFPLNMNEEVSRKAYLTKIYKAQQIQTHIYKLLNAVERSDNRTPLFPPGYSNFFINNNSKKVKKHGFI